MPVTYILIYETIDAWNSTQLVVFVKRCDENLKIREKLLEIPLLGTTTVTDLYNSLVKVLLNILI